MLSETPEHSALWGPWVCQESHLPREEQLSVHLSTCWPKGDRQRDETSLKPRQGSEAKTAAVATPESKAPSVTATAGRRRQKGAKVSHSYCSVVRHWHPGKHPCLWISRPQRPIHCFHLGIWLTHNGYGWEKEEVTEAAGWWAQRLRAPRPRSCWVQAPAALPAFLLGLAMILTWPQIKGKKHREREKERKKEEKERKTTPRGLSFKDTDYLNEEKRSRERTAFKSKQQPEFRHCLRTHAIALITPTNIKALNIFA